MKITGSHHLAVDLFAERLLIFTFFIAHTQALFFFAGMPRAVPTLLVDGSILVLFAVAILQSWFRKSMPLPEGAIPVGCILIVHFISLSINRSECLPAAFAFRQVFVLPLLYFAVRLFDLPKDRLYRVLSVIAACVLFQLPVALLKFLIQGQNEFWVGTISTSAGALSTTFPLCAISFVVAIFLYTRKKFILLLVPAFFLFGITGEKRAIAFFLPLVLGGVAALYLAVEKSRKPDLLKKFLIAAVGIGLVGFSGIYIASQTIRTLNPDRTFGGRFDPVYLVKERLIGYNMKTMARENDPTAPNPLILKNSDGVIMLFKHDSTMGRMAITLTAVRKLVDSDGVKFIFGFGPGTMIRSPHLGRDKRSPYEKFGIFGSYTGFVVWSLQTGFAGVACLLWFLMSLVHPIWKNSRSADSIQYKILALGWIGTALFILIDFFFYSQTTLTQTAIYPSFLFIAALLTGRSEKPANAT